MRRYDEEPSMQYPAGGPITVQISALSGLISRKELKIGGDYFNIPVDNVDVGSSVQVHIYGKNTSDISQKLGVRWWVNDPQLVKVQDYTDWQTGTTGVGKEHHFIGPQFNVNKTGSYGAKGRYYIYAELRMDESNPTRVAFYSGTLCWTVAEQLAGAIATKQLEYDGDYYDIPAVSLEIGKRGKVHIWARNDSDSSQKFGVEWVVHDPDGLIVENYEDWEVGGTSPGDIHKFRGDDYPYNKPGTYTIRAYLYMGNEDNPTLVDSYYGTLCTVEALALAGTIVKKKLEYKPNGGTIHKDIPVASIPRNRQGKVHIWGSNDTNESQKLGISWKVKDPNGRVVENYLAWEWGGTSPQDSHEFKGSIFDFLLEGNYTIEVTLMMNEDSPQVVDSYNGTLCTVVGEFLGHISYKALEYDGEDLTIPTGQLFPGKRGKLHIWARNDTDISQKFGVKWVITDPEGIVVEDYLDWEVGGTSPGDVHKFRGDDYEYSKTGDYLVEVELMMDEDEQVVVDSYSGVLCTIGGGGATCTIAKVELEYNGAKKTAPVSNVPLNSEAKVHVHGRNNTIESVKLGVSWRVYDPTGKLIEDYLDWEFGGTSPGDTHDFRGDDFDLAEGGDYTIEAQLLVNQDNPQVADSYSGPLCSVAAVSPPIPCEDDDDCPPGFVCVNGECVPSGEEEEGGGYGWLLWAVGGVAAIAAVVIALGYKEKKKAPIKKKS